MVGFGPFYMASQLIMREKKVLWYIFCISIRKQDFGIATALDMNILKMV